MREVGGDTATATLRRDNLASASGSGVNSCWFIARHDRRVRRAKPVNLPELDRSQQR